MVVLFSLPCNGFSDLELNDVVEEDGKFYELLRYTGEDTKKIPLTLEEATSYALEQIDTNHMHPAGIHRCQLAGILKYNLNKS